MGPGGSPLDVSRPEVPVASSARVPRPSRPFPDTPLRTFPDPRHLRPPFLGPLDRIPDTTTPVGLVSPKVLTSHSAPGSDSSLLVRGLYHSPLCVRSWSLLRQTGLRRPTRRPHPGTHLGSHFPYVGFEVPWKWEVLDARPCLSWDFLLPTDPRRPSAGPPFGLVSGTPSHEASLGKDYGWIRPSGPQWWGRKGQRTRSGVGLGRESVRGSGGHGPGTLSILGRNTGYSSSTE